MKYRFFATALSLMVLLSCGGCAHYLVDVNLTDSGFRSKGKSIAVISGTKELQNSILANMISEALRKNSRYQVVPPTQIAQAVEPYPQTIKGPYKSAYFEIDTDWELGDRKKIAAIQNALGVDYLLVIWAPIFVTNGNQEAGSVPAVAQIFERPNTKEVVQMSLTVAMGKGAELYLKEGVDEAARQLAEKTNMAITGKR